MWSKTCLPKYRLEALGSEEFEKLSQSIVQKMIGCGAKIYGLGKDGGREASFEGKAPYPSMSEQWDGKWIFQAKFHDTLQLGQKEARRMIFNDLKSELEKIVNKYDHHCNNYVLFTNVQLTPAYQTGLKDRIDSELVPFFKNKIKNIHVWGGDEICRFLDNNKDIRTAYAHFITPGELVSQMIGLLDEKEKDLVEIVKLYASACYLREQYAILRDAGDVDDDEIPLKEVFIDLNTIFLSLPTDADKLQNIPFWLKEACSDPVRTSALSFLLDDSILNLVLIGGPGEGKSTLGQYVAQIYRSMLIKKINEMSNESSTFEQCVPRIPFRILLRDYGQWLSQAKDENTLYHYIAKDFSNRIGKDFSVNTLHTIIKSNPTLLILDGLDEVPDKNLRFRMMENINAFVEQVREVYKADLKVIATTRPYGYTQEFSSDNYLHLTLNALTPDKAIEYVKKWLKQREKDEQESKRIEEVFNSCLQNEIINVLTQTPLQVTILIFILKTRGIPPKQREELFEEYMKIIYQREQKNRPELLRTEPTIIYGLHQYIAYVLHRKAAHGDTAALMDMEEFRKKTTEYVSYSKQLEKPEELEKTVNQIIEEARQRLVLIESPQENKVGFRLPSIREFFAAAHLVDTAVDTTERDRRFKAISTNPHWRNVALFFAGRVGRNNPPSIASLIDVCREIDTNYPDKYLKRGAELVIKMIEERAIRESYNQIGAIHYGLTVIETISKYSFLTFQYVVWMENDLLVDIIMNLPQHYKERIVQPFLKEKLENFPVEECSIIFTMYSNLFGFDDVLKSFIRRSSASTNTELKIWAMTNAIDNGITEPWIFALIEELGNTIKPVDIQFGVTPFKIQNLALYVDQLSEKTLQFILTIPLLNFPLIREDNDFSISQAPSTKQQELLLGVIKMVEFLYDSYKHTTIRSKEDVYVVIPGVLFSESRKKLESNYKLIRNSLESLSTFNTSVKWLLSIFEFLFEHLDLKQYDQILQFQNEKKPFVARYVTGLLSSNRYDELLSIRNLIKKFPEGDYISIFEQITQLFAQSSKKDPTQPRKLVAWAMSNYNTALEKYLDADVLNKIKLLIENEEIKKLLPSILVMRKESILNSDILQMQLDYLNNNPSGEKIIFRHPSAFFEQYVTDVSTLRDLAKQITDKIFENPTGVNQNEWSILYELCLKCNILTEEHMKFFIQKMNTVHITRGLNAESIEFLKDMLENPDSKIQQLAATSMGGLNTIIDDEKISTKLFEMTQNANDENLRDYVRSLSRCYLDWNKNGTAYLTLLSNKQTEKRQQIWGTLIALAATKGDEESFLKCLYVILESSADEYSNYVKDLAYEKLKEIIRRANPADYDEKVLNLPLREIKLCI